MAFGNTANRRRFCRVAAACLLVSATVLAAGPASQGGAAVGGCEAQRFRPAIETIRQVLAEAQLPSVSVAVAEDGRVTCELSLGWADLERRIEATPSTMYSLASISKPFTATALMHLVEQGAVDLERPANQYLGASRLRAFEGKAEDATVERLLTHTAGLPLHYQFFYEGGPAVPSMDAAIARYGIIVYPPGERYFYANFGYGVLERILERVAARPYADVLRSSVLEPLGLSDTMVSDGAGVDGSRAALRYRSDRKPIPPYTFDHVGASGVWSSARDLIRFGMFHLGHDAGRKPVLSQGTRRLMQRDHASADAPGRTRGFGWGIAAAVEGRRQIAHTGSMPGVATMLSLYPDADTAIVVLTNTSNSAAIARIERALRAAVLPRVPGAAPQSPAAPESTAADSRARGTAVAAALAGQWVGRVWLRDEIVPLEIHIGADGVVRLRRGTDPEVAVEGVRLSGTWFTGRASVALASTDAAPPSSRMEHRTTLTLARRGERLSGWATALSTSTPTYGAVSFPIELTRVDAQAAVVLLQAAPLAQAPRRPILFDSDRTGSPEIYSLDPDGSTPPKQLTRQSATGGASSFASWSPDGRMIAFVLTAERNADIAVMQTDGSGLRRLTDGPSTDLYPAWSPDGKRIAFVSDRDGNRDVYVMQADGSDQRNLTRHAAFDSRPSWSPDGSRIVFGSDRDQSGRPTPNLHVMRDDGSEIRRLTNHSRADMVARFSPDGGHIAFASNRDGIQQIYVMKADGSSVRRLTSTPEANGGPAWSPDGSSLVFNSDRDGNAEIYTMKSDGTGARRLTVDPASDVHPFW